MTEWKAVFKNQMRRKEDERWACVGCSSILDQPHDQTPKDGICTCPACTGKTVSTPYKENFDQINWSGLGCKFVEVGRKGGKVTYRFGGEDERQ